MNLPSSFTEYTRALLGDNVYDDFYAALQQEPPVSIRMNRKPGQEHLLSDAVSIRVPWCSEGYYLDRRFTFTFDPLFHAGCYYVQEASSMFVEQVMKQYVTNPSVMLDLCAAPGGKSTHVSSLLPAGSLLVANEVIRNRSQILAENLTKWGNPDVIVTNNDPGDFSRLGCFFDVILTDVPCSGEGMFRKDPGAVAEWSPENVEVCWQRQRRIIADVWPSLKPGGILIYSTCTYNTKEDEENVKWICDTFGALSLEVEVSGDWNITGNLLPDSSIPVYHFLPHKTRGEGFFLAALRKPETMNDGYRPIVSPSANKKEKKKKGGTSQSVAKEYLSLAGTWIQDAADYEIFSNGTSVTAFSKKYREELEPISRSLKVVQAGLSLGEVKGKDLVPDHALSMSRLLNPDAFIRQPLTYEQAIAYLRKEAIVLPDEAPKGFVLVTYKNIPLGFVKNIGNRANNVYPQEWRIRSGYLPEEIVIL